jgi:cytochrome c5
METMKDDSAAWLCRATIVSVFVYGCHYTLTQMGRGERLYRAKCSGCHTLISPARHDQETWRLYVDKYGKKMSAEEKRIVMEYLADPDDRGGQSPETD